ncbi:MAG: hypothetical protein NVS4B7_14080 [Ktedonobacteraceae bacterium]
MQLAGNPLIMQVCTFQQHEEGQALLSLHLGETMACDVVVMG